MECTQESDIIFAEHLGKAITEINLALGMKEAKRSGKQFRKELDKTLSTLMNLVGWYRTTLSPYHAVNWNS
jgi:hypothetical protein